MQTAFDVSSTNTHTHNVQRKVFSVIDPPLLELKMNLVVMHIIFSLMIVVLHTCSLWSKELHTWNKQRGRGNKVLYLLEKRVTLIIVWFPRKQLQLKFSLKKKWFLLKKICFVKKICKLKVWVFIQIQSNHTCLISYEIYYI